MERYLLILFCAVFSLSSCKKEETPRRGTVTINNNLVFDDNLQTPQGYGFLFSTASIVSIYNTPPPDITIDTDGADLFFQANNLLNSFFKAGEYPDEATAKQAFDNLTSPVVSQWQGLALPLQANQLWIYQSGSEHYTKIRIISLKSEDKPGRDYAECTFEWVYQPDGTLTFPGR